MAAIFSLLMLTLFHYMQTKESELLLKKVASKEPSPKPMK